MTTTLKAIVRKLRTDGLYAVYTRIVHNRKPGYIKTNKIVDANYISKENEPTDPVVNEYCSMLVRQYTDRLNRTNTAHSTERYNSLNVNFQCFQLMVLGDFVS